MEVSVLFLTLRGRWQRRSLPATRRNSSPCQITSETRAEPLTEGVKTQQWGSRLDAAALYGSWNRLTPSAA